MTNPSPNIARIMDTFDSLQMGVISVDCSMLVTLFNSEAERITELSRSFCVSKDVSEIFSADKWITEVLQDTLENEKNYTEHEQTIKRRLSGPVSVSVTTNRVYGPNGELSGALLVIKDLTGLKPLEEENLRRERLEFMSNFAANLAHEVKNPLAGIRGSAELLKRRLSGDEDKEFTSIIIDTVDRLNHLIIDMLDFVRSSSIRVRPINIHKVLDSALLLITSSDVDATLRVKKEYDPSLPLVLGEEGKLMQVFVNIIKNAAEALSGTPEGTDRVVTVMTKVDAHMHVTTGRKKTRFGAIRVSDNGPGMDSDTARKILAPFYTTKRGGSGLGMAICQRIITEHEGILKVDSTLGEGTSVTVYLPLSDKTVDKDK